MLGSVHQFALVYVSLYIRTFEFFIFVFFWQNDIMAFYEIKLTKTLSVKDYGDRIFKCDES